MVIEGAVWANTARLLGQLSTVDGHAPNVSKGGGGAHGCSDRVEIRTGGDQRRQRLWAATFAVCVGAKATAGKHEPTGAPGLMAGGGRRWSVHV